MNAEDALVWRRSPRGLWHGWDGERLLCGGAPQAWDAEQDALPVGPTPVCERCLREFVVCLDRAELLMHLARIGAVEETGPDRGPYLTQYQVKDRGILRDELELTEAKLRNGVDGGAQWQRDQLERLLVRSALWRAAP